MSKLLSLPMGCTSSVLYRSGYTYCSVALGMYLPHACSCNNACDGSLVLSPQSLYNQEGVLRLVLSYPDACMHKISKQHIGLHAGELPLATMQRRSLQVNSPPKVVAEAAEVVVQGTVQHPRGPQDLNVLLGNVL